MRSVARSASPSQHLGSVRDRLRIREDRKSTRIVRSDPGAIERGDDRSSGLVLGASPEAPGRRPEEQVDGDVPGTGVLRPVRRVDQGSKTPGVREIAERDDLADGDQASPLDRAHVGGVRQARELRRDAALAELARQLGRPEPQRTAPRRVRRELGRSPQPADPHGRRPALKRPCRGLLELARQGLIDAHRRGRAMPELLVELVIQGSGERLVNPHALGERRRPMDRRSHQRVPEVHVRGGVDLDQSHLGGGVDRLDRQPVTDDAAGRLQQLLQLTRGVDRRRQQEHAGLCGQLLDARGERSLQARGQRQQVRRWPGVVIDRSHRRRELHERQRVARRLPEDALLRAPRQIRRVLSQERRGRRVVQRREVELVEAGVGDRLAANGEQRHDRVGGQPPGDERQHVDRGRVQELGVVGDEEQRPVGGCVREELERGERDPERVGGLRFFQPERDEQVPPLDHAELVEPRQQRGKQLVETGERQVRLGLHPPGRVHGHRPLSRLLDDRLEEPRLADAGVAANDARAACTRRRALEHGSRSASSTSRP